MLISPHLFDHDSRITPSGPCPKRGGGGRLDPRGKATGPLPVRVEPSTPRGRRTVGCFVVPSGRSTIGVGTRWRTNSANRRAGPSRNGANRNGAAPEFHPNAGNAPAIG